MTRRFLKPQQQIYRIIKIIFTKVHSVALLLALALMYQLQMNDDIHLSLENQFCTHNSTIPLQTFFLFYTLAG